MATPPHILAAGPQKQACNRKIELIRLSDGSRLQPSRGAPLGTLRMVSYQSEGTFERLRYPFGGDRPSQTPRLTLSPDRLTAAG